MTGRGKETLTVYLLARGAMAVLCIERLLPTQLIGHSTAMAATLIASMKAGIIVVHAVGRTMFPRVELAIGASRVSIFAVRCVS